MVKRTDSTNEWIIFDTSRDTFNVVDSYLVAQASSAESTFSGLTVDILSNGFKLRGTDTSINASGGSYIYMAFAENPFKNSLAR